MNFLPLLMMMNNFSKNANNSSNSNSIDSMIDNLSKVKQFENMGNGGGMDAVFNMMGGNNPEMKNAMQMAQMMSKMTNSNATSSNNASTMSANTQGVKVNMQDSPSNTEQNQQKKDDQYQTESNPLKPITKIANRDITYMLNRYIND